MNIVELIDIVIKIIGVIVIITAVLQLRETQKRRMVEMYWKLSEIHASPDMQEAHTALDLIPEKLPDLKPVFEQKPIDEATKERLIQEYQQRFHDAKPESQEKQLDKKARTRAHFLNQVGVLVRKNLVDKDLVFGLLGIGLEIDYPVLQILIESRRRSHSNPHMYREVDNLLAEYLRWKNK